MDIRAPVDPSKIVIIALDMNTSVEDKTNYVAASASHKIALLAERIKQTCEDLAVKEPDAMWVVAWREYGVSDKSHFKGLAPEIRTLLKKTMSELTKQYPQLTIIAGTVSTKKQIQNPEKLDKIIQYYEDHSWVKEIEGQTLFAMESELAKTAAIQHAGKENEIEVIRNTCYIFNKDQIWRHDKITPFFEKNNNDINALYQPGNKKNISNSPLCTLSHPYTNFPVTIGVDICNEHANGSLQKLSKDTALLPFVLSSSIPLMSDNMHGRVVLHADSFYPIKLYHLDSDTDQPPVLIHYYQNNIHQAHFLHGPLESYGVFVLQVIDKLNKAILAFPNHQTLLNDLKLNFQITVKKYENNLARANDIYAFIEQMLPKLYSAAKIPASTPLFTTHSLTQLADEIIN